MSFPEDQEPIPKWQAIYRFGYRNLRRVLGRVYLIFTGLSSSEFGLDYPKVFIVRKAEPLKRGSAKDLTPKVSVIMPFHNRKDFLSEAVESALESEGVRVELILVDDASNDGASEIALEFSERGDNVVYIRNPQSLGAYVSRNLGILAASGEYLAFLDSDDTQDPWRLAKQVEVLRMQPSTKICLSGAEVFNETFDSPPSGRRRFAYISLVFEQSLVEQQGYFDQVRFGGDSEFIYRTLRNYSTGSVALLTQPLYKVRRAKGSLVTSGAGNFFPDGDLSRKPVAPEPRQRYAKAFKEAHKAYNGDTFLVPFPQLERLIQLEDSSNLVDFPGLSQP